jgi:uncharacterized membrane-anchored protein
MNTPKCPNALSRFQRFRCPSGIGNVKFNLALMNAGKRINKSFFSEHADLDIAEIHEIRFLIQAAGNPNRIILVMIANTLLCRLTNFNFMKATLAISFITLLSLFAFGQEVDSTQIRIDMMEKSLEYQTGSVELEGGFATLSVPEGFRFLDKTQTMYVMSEWWGNPLDSSLLGAIVPDNRGLLATNSWLYTISYDAIGYVEDDDAEDIDYDDLLEEQQKETLESNPERIKLGYPSIEFVGWASAPFYDKDKKILHWAKELKFGEDSVHTLNYNLRVLGRKGMFMINAVASMPELNEVNASVDKVIESVEFKEGSKYSDFDPEVDNVAAWTIGGLVAGKILAKAGFFVLLLKFWKVIALAVAGGGAAIWKYFKGKRDSAGRPV